ncbi:MAG: 50S ribosomal protein L17 [Candidatus Omnitrophota bacterium]|nr:50S ribosomal protein L17 [Candidatus Omnitrophota bacterium]
MRHRKRSSKLSMMSSHRKAMLRNMVRNLLKYQRIETTLARAKEARRLAEKVLTIARTDTVFSRRRAYEVLPDRDLIRRLFKEIAPLFKDRHSGYTRVIATGFRRGDGANMAILELTEKKIVEKLPKKKKEKLGTEEAKPEKTAGAQEAKKPKEGHEKEMKREDSGIKMPSKAKQTLVEEKRAEKAKSEDKKAADKRGFMKNLRGLFRKRGDF